MAAMTVKDIDLKNKVVLMRADFNVPLDDQLNITDDTRIQATLPTLKYLLQIGVRKIVLMSHLGRPDGKVVAKYSLKPVAARLGELLKQEVKFLSDCVGDAVKKEVDSASQKVVLLENLRYHPEEEANDPGFAQKLALLGEVYVNDAFGTAHRAHASTEGVTHYLKSVAGFLLEKEIHYLGDTLHSPQKPFIVILGGAKVSDKIGMIENLLPKCDMIIVGGGMSYTFLKAKGISIGNSKLEKDKLDLAKSLLDQAAALKKEIVLPVDHLVVDTIDAKALTEIVGLNIPDGKIAVDIGPKTIALFKAKLKDAKTIVWNGPLGIFEIDAFSQGTRQIIAYVAALQATSIIGGGDTAAAVAKFQFEDKMTHISTGGGASLEFLEGKTLPGVAALAQK